jgi:cytoskeleton protein RodZ|tara:strand:+ start:449 stop:1225 length:777 start_codon:yes stop_codon:yes gene_type:complete
MQVFRMNGSEPKTNTTQPSGIDAVGAAIRQGRESRSISRDALAQRLHMGCEQLEALEQGDRHRLPEPVFIKAMVRRLASHLELDADSLVAQLGPVSCRPPTANTTPPAQSAAEQSSGTPWLAILLSLMALIGIGSWARRLLPNTSSAVISQGATIKAFPETVKQPPAELPQKADQIIAAETTASITLDCREPCWIALRRDGTVEFEGTLDVPKTVEDTEGVEIYPGRPDLVTLHRAGDEPITLGSINDLRWYSLNPER